MPRFMTKIYNRKKLQEFRSELRNRMTKSEVVFWKFVQNDQFGYRFRRQYGIGNYIIDFYCPKLKLAIEIDGITHADEKVLEKDLMKEGFLKSIGISLRRYSSDQILNDLNNVLMDLGVMCGKYEASATPPTPS